MPATSAASAARRPAPGRAPVSPAPTMSSVELPRLLPQLATARYSPVDGVEQVGGHCGVHCQAGAVDAERQQRAHELLDLVAHDTGRASTAVSFSATEARRAGAVGTSTPRPGLLAVRGHQDQRRPGRCARARRSSGRRGPVAPCRARRAPCRLGRRRRAAPPRGARRSAATRSAGDGRPVGLGGRSPPRRRPRPGGRRARGHGPRPARPRRAARPGGRQTVFISKRSNVASAVGRGPTRPAVSCVDVHVERHVAHERDHAGVRAGQLLVVGQVLPQLRASARRGGRRCRRGRRTW